MDWRKTKELLKQFQDKEEYDCVFNPKEMRESYDTYQRITGGRKARFNIPSIDYALYGGARPGQVVVINGDTNVGKTAVAQHVAKGNCETQLDRAAGVASLETTDYEHYERYIQAEYGISTYEVEGAFQKNNKDLLREWQAFEEKYANLYTIVKRLDINEILPYMYVIEKLSGMKLSCMIIDWLGQMTNEKFFKEYDRISENMYSFKAISLHTRVPFFIFSQTDRVSKKEGITGLYSSKGSGAIEDIANIFLSLSIITPEEAAKKSIIYPADIQAAIEENKIYVMRAKLEKKKQGSLTEAMLLVNKKTTRIAEYHPRYSYHHDFMKQVSASAKSTLFNT
jgi:replicative DNA helicase